MTFFARVVAADPSRSRFIEIIFFDFFNVEVDVAISYQIAVKIDVKADVRWKIWKTRFGPSTILRKLEVGIKPTLLGHYEIRGFYLREKVARMILYPIFDNVRLGETQWTEG